MGVRERTEERLKKAKEQKAKLKYQAEKAKNAGLDYMLKPIFDIIFGINIEIKKFEERLQEL